MKARIGDRIVIDSAHLAKPCRVGVITGVGRPAGSPPYSVRWLDGGHTTLILPGARVRIEAADRDPG